MSASIFGEDFDVNLCRCGCGSPLARHGGSGRPKLFATKTCGRIVAQARLAGWNENSEETPRAFLQMARRRLHGPTREDQKIAETAAPLTFVNPRLCECGCGRAARFHDRLCALEVARRDKEKQEAEKPAPPALKKRAPKTAPPWVR